MSEQKYPMLTEAQEKEIERLQYEAIRLVEEFQKNTGIRLKAFVIRDRGHLYDFSIDLPTL